MELIGFLATVLFFLFTLITSIVCIDDSKYDNWYLKYIYVYSAISSVVMIVYVVKNNYSILFN
jgi:hypothetical protein